MIRWWFRYWNSRYDTDYMSKCLLLVRLLRFLTPVFSLPSLKSELKNLGMQWVNKSYFEINIALSCIKSIITIFKPKFLQQRQNNVFHPYTLKHLCIPTKYCTVKTAYKLAQQSSQINMRPYAFRLHMRFICGTWISR